MKKQSFYYLVYSLLSIFFVLFLSIDVNASEVNVTNKIKWSTNWIGGTYGGDELSDGYNTIYPPFNVNTRYTGKLGYLEFYLSGDDYSFTTNHTYTITLNMATNDWRNNFMGPIVTKHNSDGSIQATNNHLTVSNFRFISRKQIKFNFKTNGTLSPFYKFVLYSNNYASKGGTAITGDSNWNLSSIIISDNVSSGGSSSGSSSTPTPSPTSTPSASNKDIIDNANQNTQDIISSVGESILNGAQSIFDNASQNTTDIINNANQNTQDIIDNQNYLLGNCELQQISNINAVGSISTTDYYYETQPLDLQYFKKGKYYWGFNVSDLNMGGFIRLSATLLIWYNDGTPYQEIHIDYDKNGSFVSEPFTINSDNVSSAYFRFLRTSVIDDTVKSGNFSNIFIGKYKYPTEYNFGSQKCTSKQDETTSAIEEQTEVSRGILGKIGDIFTSIINLPIKIAEKLLDMLKSLFIPDSEEFQDLINDFKDTMSEKLGVIYQAGDLIINIFTSIINDDSPENACLTFPNVSLPDGTDIIQEQQFCFNTVTDEFPILLTLIRSLSGIFITITFINMLKKKYDDFINGGHL